MGYTESLTDPSYRGQVSSPLALQVCGVLTCHCGPALDLDDAHDRKLWGPRPDPAGRNGDPPKLTQHPSTRKGVFNAVQCPLNLLSGLAQGVREQSNPRSCADRSRLFAGIRLMGLGLHLIGIFTHTLCG